MKNNIANHTASIQIDKIKPTLKKTVTALLLVVEMAVSPKVT